MANIIGTERFKEHLEGWLFKNNQKNADFLLSNRSDIPQMFRNYSRKLYRGMKVDEEFLEKLKNGKHTFDKHTSWSKDEKVARKFVDDPAYSLGGKGNHKIIFTKTFQPREQIFDIDAFVLFMGKDQLEILGYDETNLDSAIKEKEVLISKGISVSRTDYKFL